MTKERLIDTIKRVLNTDHDFNYLAKLTEPELETLVACIRDRVDRAGTESAVQGFRHSFFKGMRKRTRGKGSVP
jgi:hypothetical protein